MFVGELISSGVVILIFFVITKCVGMITYKGAARFKLPRPAIWGIACSALFPLIMVSSADLSWKLSGDTTKFALEVVTAGLVWALVGFFIIREHNKTLQGV